MTDLFLIYKLDLHSTTCNANANIPCASVTARTGHHFLMLLDPPSSPLHHWASPSPLSDSMGLAFAPVVKQDWRPSNPNRITMQMIVTKDYGYPIFILFHVL